MFGKVYRVIWPFVFFGFGIYALISDAGGHAHHGGDGGPEVLGISLHTLMWFLMGLAHADALFGAHGPHRSSGS